MESYNINGAHLLLFIIIIASLIKYMQKKPRYYFKKTKILGFNIIITKETNNN